MIFLTILGIFINFILHSTDIMEFLMSIFFILILLFLGFVIIWWIGLFVPDDKDMEVLKKIVYTIFGILVFILSHL